MVYKRWQKNSVKTWFHRKKKLQKGKFIIRDEYAIKAQKEWYRARSAYKLLEIQERFWIIKPDLFVIDIWSAPWSFLQILAKIIKKQIIIWVDLQEIKSFPQKNIHTLICDIFDFKKLQQQLLSLDVKQQFDLITSDISPKTTWRFDIDQYASVELNVAICEFSDVFLKKWGNMLLKVFQWEDFYELSRAVKKRFMSMKTYKPLACRDSSHETYVICLWKK